MLPFAVINNMAEDLHPLSEWEGDMTNDIRYKILMVATEAVPFAKEGGVADVIGSLPKELAALGHQVCIFLPRYGTIDPARWALKPTGVVRTISMAGFDQTISIW